MKTTLEKLWGFRISPKAWVLLGGAVVGQIASMGGISMPGVWAFDAASLVLLALFFGEIAESLEVSYEAVEDPHSFIQDTYQVPIIAGFQDPLQSINAWAEANGLALTYRITRSDYFVFFKPELSDPYRFLITKKNDHYLLRRFQ